MEHTEGSPTGIPTAESRWWRFVWLLGLLLVPGLFLLWGRAIVDRVASEAYLGDLQRRMDLRLDRLGPYIDEGFDLHQRLKNIFQQAESAADPIARLRVSLPEFKRHHAGLFRFFVWNAKGEVISELTDQAGYRFVLRQLWETLQELHHNQNSSAPQAPMHLDTVQRNTTLLRSFIGPFLAMHHLTRPLTPGEMHPIPLSHIKADQSRFWFQAGKRLTLFCLIGSTPFAQPKSLRQVIHRHNTAKPRSFQIALFHEGSNRLELPGGTLSHPREAVRGLRKLQKQLTGTVQTHHLLVTWRNLDVGVWAVAFSNTSTFLQERQRRTIRWVLISLLLGFLSWYAITRTGQTEHRSSARWRIMALFLSANGLPLLILGFWSADYLQQKEKALVNEAHIQGEKTLRNFDARFPTFLHSLESYSQKQFSAFCRTARVPLGPEDTLRIRQVVQTLGADQYYLIASESGEMIDRIGAEKNGKLQTVEAMGSAYAFSVLTRINADLTRHQLSPEARRRLTFQGVTLDASDGAMDDLRNIISLNLLGENRFAILHPFAFSHRPGADYLVVMLWNFPNAVRLFLADSLLSVNRQENGLRLLVKEDRGSAFWAPGFSISSSLAEFFRRTVSRDHLFSDTLFLKEGKFLAAGLPGQNLLGFTLATLFPYETIRRQLNRTRFWLFFLMIVSLVLSLFLSVLITRRFLGPITQLSLAISAAHERDLTHRVPELSADELGQLGQAINHALENFEELNLGRIVQEQLFPTETLDYAGFRLYGKCFTMTELGGDYLDMFPLDEHRIAVVFGDVAGHGVPAALVMAMAKAFFSRRENTTFKPALLLAEFSHLLYSLKSGNSRKMMTMLIAILDGRDGKVDLVNAGQTFPLLITGSGAKAQFLEVPGVPVGTIKKPKFGDLSLTLESGDTLLFYTDGLVEARNAAGQEFDYEHLIQVGKARWHHDPETLYQNLRQAYHAHLGGAAAQDDFTMLLIQRHLSNRGKQG